MVHMLQGHHTYVGCSMAFQCVMHTAALLCTCVSCSIALHFILKITGSQYYHVVPVDCSLSYSVHHYCYIAVGYKFNKYIALPKLNTMCWLSCNTFALFLQNERLRVGIKVQAHLAEAVMIAIGTHSWYSNKSSPQ